MSLQHSNTGHPTYSYAAGVRNEQIYGRGYFKPQWTKAAGDVKVPKVAKGKEAKGKATKGKAAKPEKVPAYLHPEGYLHPDLSVCLLNVRALLPRPPHLPRTSRAGWLDTPSHPLVSLTTSCHTGGVCVKLIVLALLARVEPTQQNTPLPDNIQLSTGAPTEHAPRQLRRAYC